MDYIMIVYFVLIIILWITFINIVKSAVEKTAHEDGTFVYHLDIKISDYIDHKIIGETYSNEVCTLTDRTGEWKETVLRYRNKWVRIEYDISFSGIIFINIENTIYGINLLYNTS